MATKNIEINYKNSSNEYDTLYPTTIGSNVYLDSDDNLTIIDKINNIYADQVFEVGDILCTTKSNLSNKWLLCDGSYVGEEEAGDLGSVLNEEIGGNWQKQEIEETFFQGIWYCNGVYFSSEQLSSQPITLNIIYSRDLITWDILINNTSNAAIVSVLWIDTSQCFILQLDGGMIYKYNSNLQELSHIVISFDTDFVIQIMGNDAYATTSTLDYSPTQNLLIGALQSSRKETLALYKISVDDFSLQYSKMLFYNVQVYTRVNLYCLGYDDSYMLTFRESGEKGVCYKVVNDNTSSSSGLNVYNYQGKDPIFKLGNYLFGTLEHKYCSIYNDPQNSGNWGTAEPYWYLENHSTVTGGPEADVRNIQFIDIDNAVLYCSGQNNLSRINMQTNFEVETITFKEAVPLSLSSIKSCYYEEDSKKIEIFGNYYEKYTSVPQILLPNLASESTTTTKEKYYIKTKL